MYKEKLEREFRSIPHFILNRISNGHVVGNQEIAGNEELTCEPHCENRLYMILKFKLSLLK